MLEKNQTSIILLYLKTKKKWNFLDNTIKKIEQSCNYFIYIKLWYRYICFMVSFIVLNVYENFAIHMQYNWWFLPRQVCVLLPLYLRLHQAAPVLSSHQLSIPATSSDQTLSTGFVIHILVFKLGRNPCPLSCDSYNLWFKLIHL